MVVFSTAFGQIQVFFLFVIMNDLSKWGTDPNFSDIIAPSPSLTHFWPMFPFLFFLPPENIGKLLVFWCFQGVQR